MDLLGRASLDRAGSAAVDTTTAEEHRPLPLLFALPLIGGMSGLLWFAIARLVEYVVLTLPSRT